VCVDLTPEVLLIRLDVRQYTSVIGRQTDRQTHNRMINHIVTTVG